MKSQELILLFTLFITFSIQAQENYSYIFERKFKDPSDLVGYNFIPAKMEVPGTYDAKKLQPGDYSFGIARNRLIVNGDRKIGGLYEINNINSTNYGYQLILMNSRNPSIRGHLKVVLNKKHEAEAIIFKPENKANEIIFHLAEAPRKVIKKEIDYYTDLNEIVVDDVDSLWGQTIKPYMRIHMERGYQDRLYESDSTIISFVEKIAVKEKRKKIKKRKKKKEHINPEELNEDEFEEEEEEGEEEEDDEFDKNDRPNPMEEEPECDITQKTTKQYFIELKTVYRNADGTKESKFWSFSVKEFTEREDNQARKNEERYQLAFKYSRKKEVYVYLFKDRTISSLEIDGVRYLLRGH